MKVRSWTLHGLTLVVLMASMSSAAVAQPAAAAPTAAAVVNGDPITMAEVDLVIKRRPPMPGNATEAQRRQLQLESLSMLIDDRIMQQFLRKNAPQPQEAEIKKQLAELEAGLKAQKHTLEEFYRETMQTEAELRMNVTSMLQWTTYVKGHLSDADVQNYYNANRELFDQVTVRASHILIRLAPTCTEAERQAARIQLQGLRQQILAGQIDFAEAAKKYSQCPSAPNGGDIGFFPRKWAVDENFARASFALKQGEVSDVVQTEYGLHLIKLTDRKAGEPSSFEKIKEEVREIAAEEMRQNILVEQRKLSKVVVNLPDMPAAKPATP